MENLVNITTERELMTTIALMRKQIEQLKYQQAPTTFITNTLTTTPVSIPAGQSLTAAFTATPPASQVLLVNPYITWFVTSVSAANQYPTGANWSGGINNYVLETYLDWGDTDNKNAVFKSTFKNNSGSPITMLYKAYFRYLQIGVS